VIHKKIEVSNDSGYVVTLIPQSDSGPHMAKAGEYRYYKRSGDSFYKMEHFDIEDMFGRRKKPELHLYTELVKLDPENGPREIIYNCAAIIGLENRGRGIAKYPYISVKVKKPYSIDHNGLYGSGHTGLPPLLRKPKENIYIFGGTSNNVIHPNTRLDITQVLIRINKTLLADNIPSIFIEAEITAEGSKMIEEKQKISGEDISSFIEDNFQGI